MSIIKEFLKDNGYTEEALTATDVNFESPKVIAAISKVTDIKEVQQFVQFAASHGLTPYSGERECLLFKVIDPQTDKGINNTVIGGFNGGGNSFEISGSRLWPWKVNAGLAGRVAWDSYLRRLNDLARENNVNHAKGENPPKYLWINLDKPYTKPALAAFLNEWLCAVQDQRIFQDDALYVVDQVATESKEQKMIVPLNQILYGPPGTGKTYNTIEAGVKAAEPEYYTSLNINLEFGPTVEQRKSLQDKYRELFKDGRIRFVTFHQSYGYEEFVEGMKAITNEDNQIEYQVQPGVFKQICLDALASVSHQPSTLKRDARIWKLSIDGVKQSKARDYCFANDLAAIGWGDTGDMSDEDRTMDQIEYFEQLGPLAKSSVMEFSGRMAEGDIVVCVKGQWSIQAVGVVSGDYQYREQGIEGRADFCHTMPVKWLVRDIDVNLYALNDNTRLTLKTCYELTRFNSTELYELLKSEGVSPNNSEKINDKPQNYVLVIDEINRGNISKIFGELITLIEPSKRRGSDEFIELTLPQSKKPFSVPDNLHIIGTMNTADRSLAMMDTALRRRFDFIEMMPKPELLANTVVNGVELEELLTVLNNRIEVLYDREHTLGHAFFMPVKALVDAGDQDKAFATLVSVFQNKIIPLLEEYFFEDWDKIRLVLADNQKDDVLQFVSEKSLDNSKLGALFGKKHGLNQYGETQKQYILKMKSDDVWQNAKAYQDIYATSDQQGE